MERLDGPEKLHDEEDGEELVETRGASDHGAGRRQASGRSVINGVKEGALIADVEEEEGLVLVRVEPARCNDRGEGAVVVCQTGVNLLESVVFPQVAWLLDLERVLPGSVVVVGVGRRREAEDGGEGALATIW
jgi:hypothetical protein